MFTYNQNIIILYQGLKNQKLYSYFLIRIIDTGCRYLKQVAIVEETIEINYVSMHQAIINDLTSTCVNEWENRKANTN